MEPSNKSPHILNTSATLFGLCYVVLTSIKALKLEKETLIDEFTTSAMMVFMVSSMVSFLAIRSTTGRSAKYEKVADYTFMVGLCLLFITTVFISFNIIQ
jgi:predicted membrane channel-forming protein YqfA (hemolysin III family)